MSPAIEKGSSNGSAETSLVALAAAGSFLKRLTILTVAVFGNLFSRSA